MRQESSDIETKEASVHALGDDEGHIFRHAVVRPCAEVSATSID